MIVIWALVLELPLCINFYYIYLVKLINIIFSIYIIALSCMPCADSQSNLGNKTASIHKETNSSSGKHPDDACSPFCICNCCNCSGFYKTTEFTALAVTIKIASKKHKIEYTSTLFSNFQNSIWQPPQIS